MKKIRLFTAAALAACLVLTGCTGSGGGEAESASSGNSAESSTVSVSGNEKAPGEERDFKFIRLSKNNSSAEDYVYEAAAEEDGPEIGEEIEEQGEQLSEEVDGDEDFRE